MSTRSSTWCIGGMVLAVAPMLASGAPAASSTAGGRTEVLYSFNGSPDAEYASTDLAVDSAGNLYGTSVLGGDFGSGTVFRLSPSGGGWTENVLYSFTSGPDGGQPYGGVTLDAQGNIYGTAVVGGTGGSCVESGCGVVWKLSNSGGSWSQRVIHDFTGGEDGYGAGGPVVLDDLGNLYGMTPTGGGFGLGVVYRLAPGSNDDWTLTVIHTFTGGDDGGAGSAGRLLVDDDGSIYGVATVGGKYGAGTIFRLTPAADGPWTQATLYSFKGQPDGVFPYGGLVRDASGNLYGTTYYGGTMGFGTVYGLFPENGGWREQVLHSFTGGRDGAFSISHLLLDSRGSLYGTTSEGGNPGCSCGTIFKLSPTRSPLGKRRWNMRVVHQFEGTPDGSFSYNGLAADSKGVFYGTTVHGGEDGDGVIYRFRP
jgi:uncharacterized repeat protein (TIGR03803 family)